MEPKTSMKTFLAGILTGFILCFLFKTAEGQGCDYNIRSKEGIVATPNFPYKYPSMKNCAWKFITTPGYKIKITFDFFEVEMKDKCTSDNVAVYDGTTTNDTLLGKFCGSKIPPSVISTGSNLLMVFHSDAYTEFSGFRAIYKTGCFYKISSEIGFISSPFYPEKYPNNEACFWEFETSPGRRIKIVFETFDLEKEEKCAYDYVAVYDGHSVNDTSLGKFCGNKVPSPISSTSHKLLLVFRSDPYAEFQGFKAMHISECTCAWIR